MKFSKALKNCKNKKALWDLHSLLNIKIKIILEI